MPNIDKLNSLADIPALEKEKDQILSGLKEVKEFIGKIGQIELTAKGAKSMGDTVKITQELNAAMKEQKKIEDQLAKATTELAKIQEKLKKINDDQLKGVDAVDKAKKRLSATETKQAKEVAFYNAQTAENNRLLKLNAQAENAVAGSIEAARIKVKQLTEERNILNLETEKGKEKAAELNAEIDKQNDFIKTNVDALAKQKINIGNYEGSAGIIVDALERARQKVETLSKAGDPGSGNLRAARTEFEALRQVVDGKEFLSYAGKVGDAQKEVKAFTRVLIDLERKDQGNSEAAIELRKHLAELTDQIGDTKAAVKALSSDTRQFDLFASSVNFAVDVFQTGIGVITAFGASEEDAAEATKTLLALQTLSTGVQGIANELTTKGTAANKAFAFMQNQVAIAMDTTATATARLRAALITVGVGALVIGLGLLIKYIIDYRAKLALSTKAQEDFNRALEEQNAEAAKEITNLKLLTNVAADTTRPYKDRLSAVKKLRGEFGPYFKDLKDEQILNGEVAKSIDAAKKAILERAKARAIESEIGKNTELQLNLFLKRERIVKNIAEQERGIVAARDKSERQMHTSLRNTLRGTLLEIDQEILDVGANIKGLFDRISNEDIKPPSIELTSPRVKKSEFDDRLLSAQADALKKLSEIQDAYLDTRINAREKAAEIEKEILAEQHETEIANINAQIAVEQTKDKVDLDAIEELNEQKKKLDKKYATSKILLEDQLNTDLLTIHQTFIAHQREIDQQDNDQFFKDQEDRLKIALDNIATQQEKEVLELAKGQEAELKDLDKWYQRRVTATREGSKAREKVDRDYAERRADIEYRYAVAALKTQIDTAAKIITARKAAGIDVTEDEKRLSELRMQLSDIETKHVIDNNKRQGKSHQEKLNDLEKSISTIRDAYNATSEFITGLVAATTDRQKNAIQEQIDALDEKKEKEIEAVNASSLSEQEKADKITRINVTAAAQKEALERRQRQLDLQRARFEKAANIGRIITETALAVVHQLASGDPYTAVGRAITAGVIGAAQLAVAIATPIPKFKHGRQKGPATLGVVGDGGVNEVVTSPDLSRAFVTPATDTLTYLPKDWKVFPDIDAFQDAAMNMVHKPLPILPVIQNNNNDGLIRAMAYEIGGLKRAIMGKQETHFHWDNGQLQKSIKNGNDWWRYIQNNI